MTLLEIEDGGPVQPVGTPEPPIQGEYLPALVGGHQRDDRAARDRPARGRVVHPRRQPAALAELGAAGRLQLPRGAGPAHRRLPRRRPAATGRPPALLRRDGRALPRPLARPLPAYGVRHRRVGPRLHDHVADAGLRLPRRDPLPRRRAARLARRAGRPSPTRSASTRRTTRSSGSTSTRSSGTEVRRMRRLVVSFHATVANYEYLVYWRFYQDGNIECEVRATGIMVTSRFAPDEEVTHGTVVDHSTYAPFHQHFIVARLDLDVDGAGTTRCSRPTPSPSRSGRPTRTASASSPRARPLRTEQEGIRDPDWASQRSWKVVNTAVPQRFRRSGRLQARAVASIPSMFDPAAPVLHRAAAIAHTLWVTPYDEDERWPCGDFPNLSAEDNGLPVWTAAGPADRGHRRRALVRLRHPPRDPARGLADHAVGHRVVLAQAVRLLRPQPRARRAAATRTTTARRSSMALLRCDFVVRGAPDEHLDHRHPAPGPRRRRSRPTRRGSTRHRRCSTSCTGCGDDSTAWTRQTALERYVEPLGLAVVMPQVGRSFYADQVHGQPYWTFLTQELPYLVARDVPRLEPAGTTPSWPGCRWAATAPCGGRCASRSGSPRWPACPASSTWRGSARDRRAPPRGRCMHAAFGDGDLAGTDVDLLHLLAAGRRRGPTAPADVRLVRHARRPVRRQRPVRAPRPRRSARRLSSPTSARRA